MDHERVSALMLQYVAAKLHLRRRRGMVFRMFGNRLARRVSVGLILVLALAHRPLPTQAEVNGPALFSRGNLIAWCIVPFDSKKRGPEERATMMKRLGFERFAYDWRAEHVPTFDAEV